MSLVVGLGPTSKYSRQLTASRHTQDHMEGSIQLLNKKVSQATSQLAKLEIQHQYAIMQNRELVRLPQI